MAERQLRTGDLLRVGHAASVQFAGSRTLILRVIRVHDWTTYDGWVWLSAYAVDHAGNALERRLVFVKVDGLVPLQDPRDDSV